VTKSMALFHPMVKIKLLIYLLLACGVANAGVTLSLEGKPPMVQVKSAPTVAPTPQKSTVLFGFDQAVLTQQAQVLLDQ
jgi:outer membrane protein OmpA-like peptidoglycan-associated protein